MKKILLLVHWVAVVNGAPIGGETLPSPNINTPVRVLLERGGRLANVEAPGSGIFLKHGNSPGWRLLGKKLTITVSQKSSVPRLALNGIGIATPHIYLRGGSHITDVLQYNRAQYRGAIRVTLVDGKLTVTNVLPLEEYLVGMLASEMSPHWEMESLKAQAVASRGYALYMMKHPKHRLFDLEKSIQDQVYRGVDSETPRVRLAVSATAGEFLAKNDEPIKAFYHSRCGGTTETSRSVWNDAGGSYQNRPCPFCQKNKYAWKTSVSLQQLARLADLPFSPTFHLSDVQRSPTGRVSRLSLESGGQKKTLSSDELRSLVGYTKLKSAYFEWEAGPLEIQFQGKGAGHGVGMCQWGARFLAKQAKNYREILSHYYPGLPIRSLLTFPDREKMLD